MGTRFHKLVKHIVQKQSPGVVTAAEQPELMVPGENEGAVEDESDAIDQEDKKLKLKARDLSPNRFS